MKIQFLITFLLLVSSCQNQNEINNPNEIFSTQDLEDLNYIADTFEDILKNHYEAGSSTKAYKFYSQEILDSMSILTPLKIEQLGKKVMELNVFEKIWKIYDPSLINNSGTYTINPKSDYLSYLKDIGKTDSMIKDYAEAYIESNDLRPSIVSGFLNFVDQLNLEDKNYRLIFAIHYLTLINN